MQGSSSRTKSLRGDAAAVRRVDDPVVVFQSVHQLQHRAHSAYGGVNGGSSNKFSRQVSV